GTSPLPLLLCSAIVQLQRSAGNQAVSGLLAPVGAGRSRAAPRLGTGGVVVVQRDAGFGLTKKDEVTGFGGVAVDFWKANKTASLEDFAKHLMDELNTQLAATGVPTLPPPSFG